MCRKILNNSNAAISVAVEGGNFSNRYGARVALKGGGPGTKILREKLSCELFIGIRSCFFAASHKLMFPN